MWVNIPSETRAMGGFLPCSMRNFARAQLLKTRLQPSRSLQMDCPVCQNSQLVMSERQGIEIDYCPKCRGVWLDRGELDKIIERAHQDAAPQNTAPPQQQPQPHYPQPPRGHEQRGYEQKYYKRKKSIWEEIFD